MKEKKSRKRRPIKPAIWALAIPLFIGGFLWNKHVPVGYLHESGHVFFAIITGGNGKVVAHNAAATTGGNPYLVNMGGVLFELLFGLGMMALGVKYAKPWLGAFSWGAAHAEFNGFVGTIDYYDAHMTPGGWRMFCLLFLLVGWLILTLLAYRNLYYPEKKGLTKSTKQLYSNR